jgi:Ca2+-binding EF-hand superfamily protein
LRLLEMSNQNLEEFVLWKIFTHFDTNNSGTITFDEFIAMVAQLKL